MYPRLTTLTCNHTNHSSGTHLYFLAEVLLFGLASLEALLRPQQLLFLLIHLPLHLSLLETHLERSNRRGVKGRRKNVYREERH